MKKSIFTLSLAVFLGFAWAVALCFRALSAQAVSVFSEESMRIVVDAGHGGIDVGVSGKRTGVKESDLNLSVALLLKEELENLGFLVEMTRKTEAGLYDTTAKGFKKRDMQKRKEIIDNFNPALLLSIHQNFYPAQSVRGGQAFYSAQNEGSELLAEGIQDRLNDLYEEEGVKRRKKMQGEYFLLNCHPCPSVIIECGFLSNAEDERLLKTSGWQKKVARAVAAGALDYFSEESA